MAGISRSLSWGKRQSEDANPGLLELNAVLIYCVTTTAKQRAHTHMGWMVGASVVAMRNVSYRFICHPARDTVWGGCGNFAGGGTQSLGACFDGHIYFLTSSSLFVFNSFILTFGGIFPTYSHHHDACKHTWSQIILDSTLWNCESKINDEIFVSSSELDRKSDQWRRLHSSGSQ